MHVSFACNQLLARCCVPVIGSEMQSGPMVAKRDDQKPDSKTKYSKSVTCDFEHICAPGFGIHVSFACS